MIHKCANCGSEFSDKVLLQIANEILNDETKITIAEDGRYTHTDEANGWKITTDGRSIMQPATHIYTLAHCASCPTAHNIEYIKNKFSYDPDALDNLTGQPDPEE
jgi:hypothetical protein